MQLLQREAPPDEQVAPDWAVLLINDLHLTYGTRFLQAWEGVSKAELALRWARALADVAPQEISTGLAACMLRPWPPTLPEFVMLCRPWMEPEIAFQQAVKGMMARQQGKRGYWAHPAIYWAALRIGSHDILAGNWQTLKIRWEAAFRHLLAQTNLHPVPAPAQALPAPGASALSKDEAHRLAAQVRQMMGQTPAPAANVKDHKAWARRILENPKGRTITVVKMARQALGLDDEGAQPLEMAA